MNSIVYVGMDVHKESYTLCCYCYDTDKVEYKQTIPSDYKLILKYMESMRSRYEGEVTFVCGYEAGCLGYSLYHQLREHEVDCKILAPTTMAITNTSHVKTDKRDASNIARCLAFHTYSEVYVPDNEDNSVKEYIRMRDDQKLMLKKIKQQILAFVLQHGKKFEGGKTYWTIAHMKWLKSLELKGLDKETLSEYLVTLNHSEQEIAGYRDALAEVHTGYGDMDFRQSDILRLHSIMMNIAGYSYAGKYKEYDNDIIEEDKNGRRRVRFHPTSAADTPDEMEQLELAYLEARDNPNINQLLLISSVILDFLCIHPFRDGNGRISRLLSLLLLYRNGFDAGKYISFEEQINDRKGNYYEALQKSSEGWHENNQDYSAFIMEFITTVYACYKELDKRFAVIGSKKVTKQARVEATVLNSLTPISKVDIGKILPEVSATTIEAVLGQMVRTGSIRKVGSGRGTKYVRN